LQKADIKNALQESQWIVKYGKYSEYDIGEIIRRRINGEPLQYLLGEWEFYGYPFKVGKGVLIPRPETELLVDLVKENVLKNERENSQKLVLDLCAGSGCVGIALAREIGCKVIAIEKSQQAFTYLKQNIALNKVAHLIKPIKADILNPAVIHQLSIDINCQLSIAINPPYLSKGEMLTLQKEVTYEPEIALYGGEDGLEFYRAFFSVWKDVLKRSAFFACEVGDGQAEIVGGFMEVIGLSPQVKYDFNGLARIVYNVGSRQRKE